MRDLCRPEEIELVEGKAMPDHRARGYCVSAVGRDEDQIRRFIREREELRWDQDRGELNLDPHTAGPGGGRRLLAGHHHRLAD